MPVLIGVNSETIFIHTAGHPDWPLSLILKKKYMRA
jgi:hypothetical protein